MYLVHSLEKKSEGDLSVFCKVEPIKQVQAVLCVLPNALLVTLQKTSKILGFYKVQSSLACMLQVRNSRSNLLRIEN